MSSAIESTATLRHGLLTQKGRRTAPSREAVFAKKRTQQRPQLNAKKETFVVVRVHTVINTRKKRNQYSEARNAVTCAGQILGNKGR